MIHQEIETTVEPGTDEYGNVTVPESWIGKDVLVQLLPDKIKFKQCNICRVYTSIEYWEESGGVCTSCNNHLKLEGY